MSKNNINGNNNIIGNNNQVTYNNQQSIHNHIHNNGNPNNGSSGNYDTSTILTFIVCAGLGIAVVIFLYAAYYPIIFSTLKLAYFLTCIVSLYFLVVERNRKIFFLFIFLLSVAFIFHFIPMISYHIKFLDVSTNVKFDNQFLKMAWNFYSSLPDNKKYGVSWNILLTIFSIFILLTSGWYLFRKNSETIWLTALLIFPILYLLYFQIGFLYKTIGYQLPL